jgi:hypothetical protein
MFKCAGYRDVGLTQASPTIAVILPVPLQIRQISSFSLPVPAHRGQMFSADCLVPGLVSSPGLLSLASGVRTCFGAISLHLRPV